ncbi:PASTA domain-containing protein [Streptomyces sp. BR123]|uniref:PASTA domain-containing protein n=1 Tax=Streptomyces sp. BR123 TaxID=2749828 RepID=UPI0027BAF1D7|nr:PASTA domain-containing protein [Streptomyces sp. BR123]
MRTHHVTAATLAAVATLALTACDPPPATTDPKPDPSQPAGSAASGKPGSSAKTAVVPNLVGMGLQAAQDAAQAAGFFALTSHDSLGRGREQILDRGWKVCSQTPGPGSSVDTSAKVDLGAVKLEEECPAKEEASPSVPAATMPNFIGKSMKAARQALPGNASITVKDALQQRMVLQESNWRVCTQSPPTGTPLDGKPATFHVVKFEETCP